MAGVLGHNVGQLVNNHARNSAGHDSFAFADRSFPKFPLENPCNLIAVDKDKWLNSSADEIDPTERTAAGARVIIPACSTVSAKCNLNHIEKFRAPCNSFALHQQNRVSKQSQQVGTREGRDYRQPNVI
jgi:hypothetical protein